jgi:hypothetical protein
LDQDGVKEAGEPGLPGWTIFIDQDFDGVLDAGETSTTTDADGNYSFTGLTPGSYVLTEVLQADWQQTYPLGSGNIVVFDDPLYVDTTSGGVNAESDNVQASLTSLGFSFTTFTGITGAQWTTALAGAGLLVIPEIETGNLSAAMQPAARTALRDFVAAGGGLVIHGSSGTSVALLNSVFSFGLIDGAAGTTKTAAAVGTAFDGDPITLPQNNATFGVSTTSLPAGALSIYASGSGTSVALIGHGSGQIAYLGYDWYDAAPIGSQDGGWLQVLESAVLEVGASGAFGSHHVSIGPGQTVTGVDFGNFAPPNLELVATNFSVTPSNLYLAGQATVDFRIENRGILPSGGFDVQFYLSDDPVINPSTDMLLLLSPSSPKYNAAEPEAVHTALAAGGNIAFSEILVVPTTDPFGTDNDYYIGMFVDADGDVSEDVESNNLNLGLGVDLDNVEYSSNIAQAPFFEDWEDADFDPWWEVIPGPAGRILVTNLNGPFEGTNHVTLDTASGSTLNQLILHINLAGHTGVTLQFANREFGDEDNVQDAVEISVNGGATWQMIVPLTGSNSTSSYTLRTFDLDALGLTYSSDTMIRFQQFDNLGIPTDGMAFDNIRVDSVVSLAGDYNRDDSVDAADYVFWRKTLGTIATPAYSGADGDGDVVIDADDRGVWESQFGASSLLGGSPVAGTSQAMYAFAAFSADASAGDGVAVPTDQPLVKSSTSLAVSSEIRARGFEDFHPRKEGSRNLRTRSASLADAAEKDQLDLALRTWLSQLQEADESDFDAIESDLCDADSARDACFDSFEAELMSLGDEVADRLTARHGARLAAVR